MDFIKWKLQPCIEDGFLTLTDAAHLMANPLGRLSHLGEGFPIGPDEEGLLDALIDEVEHTGGIEGYEPRYRYVNGRHNQAVFPVEAYLAFCKRRGYGDYDYFEARVRERERVNGINTDPIPLGWSESDLFSSENAEEASEIPDDLSVLDALDPMPEEWGSGSEAAGASSAPVDVAIPDMSRAIEFGSCTGHILRVIAEYLSRPEARRMKGTDKSTQAETLLDALNLDAKRRGWGAGLDGGVSKAQWVGIRALMLPGAVGKGRGSSVWGGKTDLDRRGDR